MARYALPIPSPSIPISCNHMSVTCLEPRFLVVSIDNGAHTGSYIVAHAPQNTASAGERRACWRKLVALTGNAPYEVVLFVDANGKVGSEEDEHIGTGGNPPKEDTNWEMLHRLLIEHNLFITSSCVECHLDLATHVHQPDRLCYHADGIQI